MEDGFEPMTMRQLELTVRASSQPVLFKTAFKRDVEKERVIIERMKGIWH